MEKKNLIKLYSETLGMISFGLFLIITILAVLEIISFKIGFIIFGSLLFANSLIFLVIWMFSNEEDENYNDSEEE